MNKTLQAVPLRDSFRILKRMCGGNARIARALGVTVGWVDRWGSSGRDGPVMSIPRDHWPKIARLSRDVVTVDDLEALHARIK